MSFNNSHARAEINSDVTDINHQFEKVELIVPTTGKLFFEHKGELIFCKPHLMPLKSQALERLEEMQRDTARQLMEKRLKTLSKSKSLKTSQ
ncbi:BBSome-interacting protein 1 [Glossina fuscipes]|uniref:BBSome-interacting protein 1 n=1 Tax=Glossina fuscipes TaxID=7396 RepID=A0A9C5Z8M6_9MUSC|nr:BBSome-interacting protein 1 [Glossina fuscipes]